MLLSLTAPYSFSSYAVDEVAPIVVTTEGDDLNRILAYSRKLLTRKPVKNLLKEIFAEQLKVTPEEAARLGLVKGATKELSEGQFVILMQDNKELWPMVDEYLKVIPNATSEDDTQAQVALRKVFKEKFNKALQNPELMAEFANHNDPLQPVVLQIKGGRGYRDLKFFANTPLKYSDGRIVPPSSLEKVLVDLLRDPKKQRVYNVFDFDLNTVADAFIDAAKRGEDIRIGIDHLNIDAKPEVKVVFDKLTKAGDEIGKLGTKLKSANAGEAEKIENEIRASLKAFAVDAVGLNHQKLMAINWQFPGEGMVYTSSGNCTTSCSGTFGDGGEKVKSEYNIANANHSLMVKSDEAAIVVNHTLTKTLDDGLRGADQPLGSLWMFYKDGQQDLIPSKRDYWIMGFTPNGTTGGINRQMVSDKLLKKLKGELKVITFAFSSDADADAIYEALQKQIKKTGTISFRSIGDTSFSGREESVLLEMIGYKKDEQTGLYVIDTESKWNKLPKEVMEKLRKNIKAAPANYGDHTITLPDGSKMKLTSKIHDKVMMDDEKGFFGTSFNFSENAETNTEVINFFKDKELINDGHAMFEGLYEQSNQTLEEVILKKNIWINASAAKCETGVMPVLNAIAGTKRKGKK